MPEKGVLMVTAILKDWKDLFLRLRSGMQDEYFIRSVFRGTKLSQGCFNRSEQGTSDFTSQGPM